jgi:hypothetical protein
MIRIKPVSGPRRGSNTTSSRLQDARFRFATVAAELNRLPVVGRSRDAVTSAARHVTEIEHGPVEPLRASRRARDRQRLLQQCLGLAEVPVPIGDCPQTIERGGRAMGDDALSHPFSESRLARGMPLM